MSELEFPSSERRLTREIQPRQPHREIAELLATAILRARQKCAAAGDVSPICHSSEVCLGFCGDQSVHVNPSQTQGVQE